MLINNNSDNYINPAITTGIAVGGSLAGLGGAVAYIKHKLSNNKK